MKKYIGGMLLIVCLLAGVGGSTANAQIYTDTTVEADIPFAFIVGTKTLPAGKYTIRTVDDTSLNLLEIRSRNGRKSAAFETQNKVAEQTARQTELVFNKVGDQYFLSQIWVEGTNTGVQLEESKIEKRLEANGSTSERHSVVARHKSSKSTKQAKTATNNN